MHGMINDYKVVLMLRDPRDVLVSFYYSVAYSHGIPVHNRKIAQRRRAARKRALNMTIDEFVLEEANVFLDRYQTYCKELLNKRNVLFVKYEDMIYDFKNWLGRIVEFLDIKVKQETLDTIINKADSGAKKEDITKHKRVVTPGDHKRKLKQTTIEKLNFKYKEIFEKLDYEIESYRRYL